MAYSVSDIITWAKITQPLAAFYESKSSATVGGSVDKDLHIKIYLTRKDVEYEQAKDPTGDKIYSIANYLYALCFPYILQAQAATGGGGSIAPITPGSAPDPLDFEVTASSFIVASATSKGISSFVGYNILFVRNNITQSTVNQGGTYYSWDKASGSFVLFNGAAQLGELFQIYPIL